MAVSTAAFTVRDGAGAGRPLSAQQDPAGQLRFAASLDGAGAASYRYADNIPLIIPNPTAILVLQGSATRTIRITSMRIYGEGGSGAGSANGAMRMKVTRRSTAGTLGTAVLVPPAIPPGTNDSGIIAAPTLTISRVTVANYDVLGDNAGILDWGVVSFFVFSGPGQHGPWTPVALNGMSEAFVLRGVNDWITIDGGPDSGGDSTVGASKVSMAIAMEWTEDAS